MIQKSINQKAISCQKFPNFLIYNIKKGRDSINNDIYNKNFEEIKHVDESGIEFWYARELMEVLSYKDWRYFDLVIEKTKKSCKNSGNTEIDHFVADNKMVEIGSGAKREQKD